MSEKVTYLRLGEGRGLSTGNAGCTDRVGLSDGLLLKRMGRFCAVLLMVISGTLGKGWGYWAKLRGRGRKEFGQGAGMSVSYFAS